MKLRIILVLVFCLSVCNEPGVCEEKTPDIKTIVDMIDHLYRADQSFSIVEMQIVNPNWKRTIEMQIWTKELKKTFIRVLSPEKDKGFATLRVGTEMWNYFPKIDKVMKVPPSMMMGSWMGSDFTNDDLVKASTLIDDYNARIIEPSDKEEGFYYIELVPKEQTASVWGKIEAKIRKNDYIPIKEEFYDEKGKKMRTIIFSNVAVMGGRKIPATMEVIPLGKEGNKTVITYKNLDFEKGIAEQVFSLRNLQKKI